MSNSRKDQNGKRKPAKKAAKNTEVKKDGTTQPKVTKRGVRLSEVSAALEAERLADPEGYAKRQAEGLADTLAHLSALSARAVQSAISRTLTSTLVSNLHIQQLNNIFESPHQLYNLLPNLRTSQAPLMAARPKVYNVDARSGCTCGCGCC